MFKRRPFFGSRESVDLEMLSQNSGPSSPNPFAGQPATRIYSNLADATHQPIIATSSRDIKHGMGLSGGFRKFISAAPSNAIVLLRRQAITKLGTFVSTDSKTYDAFSERFMLTRGYVTAEDENYVESWRSVIDKESRGHRKSFNEGEGWNEPVKVAAYCVNICDAAAPLEDGVLSPLLRKERRAEDDDEIWDFPSVCAIIEYKWNYWAKKYLFTEFALYLGWLLSFVLYLIIYIERDLNEKFHLMDAQDKAFALAAYGCDFCSVVFMLPFLIIEFNSIKYYKWRWFHMWNLIDSCIYIFQILVSLFHFSHKVFRNNTYSTILAIHCSMLFIKVQYFSRVMGVGAAYAETLRSLVYKVRYFVMFVVLNMISAALSFAALYKEDVSKKSDGKDEEVNESAKDFGSVPKSLVTTFAVLLGSFESSYVFDTDNKIVKGVYFVVFILVMSITILNILIAIMTQSYSTIAMQERILYNKGRALLIDELEIALPKFLRPNLKSYVHFIVVEKQKPIDHTLSAVKSEDIYLQFATDLHSKLDSLENMMKDLKEEVAQLRTNKDETEEPVL